MIDSMIGTATTILLGFTGGIILASLLDWLLDGKKARRESVRMESEIERQTGRRMR